MNGLIKLFNPLEFILINVIVHITPKTKFLSDIADRIRRLHARERGVTSIHSKRGCAILA